MGERDLRPAVRGWFEAAEPGAGEPYASGAAPAEPGADAVTRPLPGGPVPAATGLVGGAVPEETLAYLTARLRSETGPGLRVPWRRPGTAAFVGSIGMVVVLLVVMTLLGMLL